MTRSGPRTATKHAEIAERARAERGTWILAAVYPSLDGARGAAGRIPLAKRMPAYGPPGTFEAYAARHHDGTAVWVRYVAGLPKPEPRPSTMTYRVCDRGSGRGYVGVRIVTVKVAAECPRCGGPRGTARPYRFHEDGDWYVVDKWDNPCGHTDTYVAVLAEFRERVRAIEEAEQKAAARAVAAPVDAGEYTAAVALLNAAAAEYAGLHAKQAAQYLDMQGHEEAARRVEEELTARRGHMSARQAALFLTELAAARAACAACDDNGRINYQARDGEFVSLPCRVCRREVTPRA